jgi:hypothetical protein
MTHCASSFRSSRNFAAAVLALAVFLFVPGSAFAQHGGGGHASGGGFGGGHMGGGGGFAGRSHSSGPSHSAPPANHSAPAPTARPPATSSTAANHPTTTTTSASGAASGNTAIHAPNFGTAASTNASGSTTFALHGQAPAPHTIIGFPPSGSHVAPVARSVRNGSGALSFSGQGHEIWQDAPARGGINSVTAARPSESERVLFGRSPSLVARPFLPHRVYYQPIFFGPAFGFYPGFGYFGNGFCDPFWGFDPTFGCGGFGYGGGFGLGYGFGYGYGNYFGAGYDNSFAVGSTTGPVDFENDTPSNDDGAYSPTPEQGTDRDAGQNNGGDQQSAAPAPPLATAIYLKDGTNFDVMSYWLDAGKLHYITNYGGETSIDVSQLDLQRTVDENARLGVDFTLRPNPPAPPAPARSAPNSEPASQQ